MNKELYYVELKGFFGSVWAFSEKEAIILVQADAINNGCDYELVKAYKSKQ